MDWMTDWVRVLNDLGPHIRVAASRVAQQWPSVTTEDQLTADLSLKVMNDSNLSFAAQEMPVYRLMKFFTNMAQEMVAKEVADYAYNTGNVMYSTGQVRHLLESGSLLNTRTQITSTLPDLDMGCKFLSVTCPELATVIYRKYCKGEDMLPDLVERAVVELTQAMNSLSKGKAKING